MAEPLYREKLRTATLEIALRILEVEGLAGLQARRIAQAADCSVGTLYNLYDGIDELIIAANAATLDTLGAILHDTRLATADGTGVDRLQALATAYVDFALAHPNAWRAVFEHRMSSDRDVPAWYRDAQARLFEIVEEVLANSVPDTEARRRGARALFAAVHGIVQLSLDQKLGAFDPREMRAQVAFIVAAAARGLGPDRA